MQPELVVDAQAELGEGPVWHNGAMYWVDILAGVLHRYDPDKDADIEMDVGQPVGAVAPRAKGGFLLALRDGFGELTTFGKPPRLIVDVERDDPTTRLNDGKCDSRGRMWASAMAFDARPNVGHLYRLSTDLALSAQLGGLTIGNGLAWSADDKHFYFIDSSTQGVDVFDFDAESGLIGNRRQLITIDPQDGAPDGMAIDAEGCLWVALFGGGEVRRYTPAGELKDTIELPVSNVTCCAFGGSDLGELYITTAWHGLDKEERDKQPLAGGLFRVRPGVTGTPSNTFGG